MPPCCEHYYRSEGIKSQVMQIENGIKKSKQHRYVGRGGGGGFILDIGIKNTSPSIVSDFQSHGDSAPIVTA